jgi:ketosteroid isomerase-like protein
VSRLTILGWLLVTASTAACAANSPAARTSASPVAAVRAARMQWNAAVAGRNTAAVRRLLADSVVQTSHLFVGVGPDRYVGGLARQFARRPAFTFAYTPERVEVSRSGELASEYGRWRETWLESGEPTELRGTYFVIWRRGARGWEIVRDVFMPGSCTGPRYCGS